MLAIRRLALVTLGLVFALATGAAAFENPPSGLGKATLGMKIDAFRKAYPKVKPLPADEDDPSYRMPGMSAYQFIAKSAGLERYHPVTFRFYKDRLWAIQVGFGKNPAADVEAMLRTRHGTPTRRDRGFVWENETVRVRLDRAGKYYEILSVELADEMRKDPQLKAVRDGLLQRRGAAPHKH